MLHLHVLARPEMASQTHISCNFAHAGGPLIVKGRTAAEDVQHGIVSGGPNNGGENPGAKRHFLAQPWHAFATWVGLTRWLEAEGLIGDHKGWLHRLPYELQAQSNPSQVRPSAASALCAVLTQPFHSSAAWRDPCRNLHCCRAAHRLDQPRKDQSAERQC